MQLLFAERGLADDEVHVGVLVDAELDLAALDVGDSLRHIGGHGAGLGVGHEATGAEHLAETADLAHELRGRDRRVKGGVAARDLFDELNATDLVSTGRNSGLGCRARREDNDAGGLARAVGKVDGAAHHLVCLTRVDAELECDLNR